MARVFDGTLHVGYHTATLETNPSDGRALMPDTCFAGQANGLCGAAMHGALMFNTGLHHGGVGFTVAMVDGKPPLDESWGEIVEVSFIQEDAEATLVDFYGSIAGTFPLAAGTYRARYSARNMDKAWEVDTNTSDQPIDFYSLIFWPAPAAPDAILKQSEDSARNRY